MQRILITGSKGFVGTNLSRYLRDKYQIVEYDLVDGQNIFNTQMLDSSMRDVDIVIHLAAFVSGSESWEKPEEYFVNNGIGTYKVIRSAIDNKVKKIIIFSSAAVYGDPLTPYGTSKLMAEAISKSFQSLIPIIIVRPFNIYGLGQNPAYGYVIHNFINDILNKNKVRIYGDGLQTRDFIHIDDVVGVVDKLITYKEVSNPIDLGTGKSVKIATLAKMIGKKLDKDFSFDFLPARNESKYSQANISHLNEIGIDTKKFKSISDGLDFLIK